MTAVMMMAQVVGWLRRDQLAVVVIFEWLDAELSHVRYLSFDFGPLVIDGVKPLFKFNPTRTSWAQAEACSADTTLINWPRVNEISISFQITCIVLRHDQPIAPIANNVKWFFRRLAQRAP